MGTEAAHTSGSASICSSCLACRPRAAPGPKTSIAVSSTTIRVPVMRRQSCGIMRKSVSASAEYCWSQSKLALRSSGNSEPRQCVANLLLADTVGSRPSY